MAFVGYSSEEKARIRHGIQCPECFGVRTEPVSERQFERHRYQCNECGCQWSASAPQFQSAERRIEK